jgi:hypothetical protein
MSSDGLELVLIRQSFGKNRIIRTAQKVHDKLAITSNLLQYVSR